MDTYRSTLHEYWPRIKGLADHTIGEWGLGALFTIVALGSFGLGRLSALEDVRPPVSLDMARTFAEPSGIVLGGQYVASRAGHTYYFPWCSGAENLKPSNQVWFSSEDEARKAGYAPASGCKGLSAASQ